MKNLLQKITDRDDKASIELIQELIAAIRPSNSKNGKEATDNLHNLIAHLRLNPDFRVALRNQFALIFSMYDPVYLYTELGILSNRGFFSEFWRKVKHKILPELNESKNGVHLLNTLFNHKADYKWIKEIPQHLWVEILELLDIQKIFIAPGKSRDALSSAMQLLSHHIVTLGLDEDITRKIKYLDKLDSPFHKQNQDLLTFLGSSIHGKQTMEKYKAYDEVKSSLQACLVDIEQLHQRRDEFGTSLHITQLSKRLRQKIRRLQLLLIILNATDKKVFYLHFLELAVTLIQAGNARNHLGKLINDHVDLLAFEMVEHTAQKGGSYIAQNAREFWTYLRASMLGGAVIALFALSKILIDGFDVAPLGQGILFSINYAACFVLVYLFGGIIATKQPAMTASAVARSMDRNNDGVIDDIIGLKDLIIKVSRSQFISFVGNLIMAIPISILIRFLVESIFEISLISPEKSAKMFEEIHPFESGAIYYAAIAGVFLSLSGLISGYFSNKLVYSQIPQRIENHPGLNRWFSTKATRKFSTYINKNLGALTGNISLGFFLGMAGTFGFISGLPFDIRHIAFSSANFGYALFDINTLNITTAVLMMIAGIAGIGLMNFTVSFGLTLFIALKSRKISFGQTKTLTTLIYKHLKQKPLDFFLQPGSFQSLGFVFGKKRNNSPFSKGDQ